MILNHKSLISTFVFSLLINFGFAQESGLASYYGDAFHGGQTASGELYDRSKMTCAHRTLPFGTYLKVTRKDNGRSVTVKVNDRGPHIKGRIVDVSKEAAKRLGLIKDGVAEVTIAKTSKSSSNSADAKITSTKGAAVPAEKEVVRKVTEAEKAVDAAKAADKREKELAAKAAAEKRDRGKAAADAKRKAAEKAKLAAAEKKEETIELKEPKLVSLKNYSEYGLYKIQVMKPEKKGFGVQVASINNHENMLKQIAHFQGKHFKNILTSIEKGAAGTVYKIILGPFPDQKTAQSYKRSLAKRHKVNGFVVNLESPKK